jgi:hypothetical protein
MRIDEQLPVTYEATFQKGHFTIWGDPAVLLSTVIRVVRLDRPTSRQAREPLMDYSITMSDSDMAPIPLLTGTVYEICDVEAQGAIWATATESEAVEFVSKCYRDFGAEYVESMSIVRWDEDGNAALIAKGIEIVDRCQASSVNQLEISDLG